MLYVEACGILLKRDGVCNRVTHGLSVLRTSNVIFIPLKIAPGRYYFFDAQAGNASSRWRPNWFIPELLAGLKDSSNVKTFGTGFLGNSQQITPQILPEYHLKT